MFTDLGEKGDVRLREKGTKREGFTAHSAPQQLGAQRQTGFLDSVAELCLAFHLHTVRTALLVCFGRKKMSDSERKGQRERGSLHILHLNSWEHSDVQDFLTLSLNCA